MAQWARDGVRLFRSRPSLSTSCCGVMTKCRVTLRPVAPAKRTAGQRALSVQSTAESRLWKQVYRAFLLAVHPDFFHEHPKERAMNERNLKLFQEHLQHLDMRGGIGELDNGKRLVFFIKPGATLRGDEREVSSDSTFNDTHEPSDPPIPRKVILPLQSHRSMAELLREVGVSQTSFPVQEESLPDEIGTKGTSASAGNRRSGSTRSWDWEGWVEDLFGETSANRAWDREAARKRKSASSSGERSEGFGFSRLGHVLDTDAGRKLVRERRTSARNVRKLVDQLRQQHGFGEFTFRCGWSKSNLCVALRSLLETCDAHRAAFRVPDFGGLEVVFRHDPSVLRKGEIRLCPADVPLEWVSVLQGVTPALLSEVEQDARDLVSMEEQASTFLRGARLTRGLSCSKSRYRYFLGRTCMPEEYVSEAGSATDVSPGDWSVLLCRVEEGFSRVSKILEDGTIQVGSDMTLKTLRQCLERDFAKASSITVDSARLAATASEMASRCRQSLGLEAIVRSRRVTFPQMISACQALMRVSQDDSSGSGGEAFAAAAAVRRRLRGHCVRVVGARVGVDDGVTEEGEIAIPWNCAEDEEGTEA